MQSKTHSKKKSNLQNLGRPRSVEADKRILKAAYALTLERGYAEVTMDAIATKAKVGKPTIYLRWPRKAHLVLHALLSVVDESISFKKATSLRATLRKQLLGYVKLMNGPQGRIIATIIGGGQSDLELLNAYRESWWAPRRAAARKVFAKAVDDGELSAAVDVDLAIDLLFSPIWYRLLLKHAPINKEFAYQLVDAALTGLQARRSAP